MKECDYPVRTVELFLKISASVLFLVPWQMPASPPGATAPDAESHRGRIETRDRHEQSEYRKGAFPLKTIPSGARYRAQAQTLQAEASSPRPKGPLTFFSWYNIGPSHGQSVRTSSTSPHSSNDPFIQQSVKPVEQSRLCCQCGQK